MIYINQKVNIFETIINCLDEDKAMSAINAYFKAECDMAHGVHPMSEFDDVCNELNLSPTEIADGVLDGYFRTYDDYFRYDGREFSSCNHTPNGLVDFDEDFIHVYEEMNQFELKEIGINPNELLSEYCSYNDIDEDKLKNHPNFDMDTFLKADWDTYLEDEEMEECSNDYEEDEDDDE